MGPHFVYMVYNLYVMGSRGAHGRILGYNLPPRPSFGPGVKQLRVPLSVVGAV